MEFLTAFNFFMVNLQLNKLKSLACVKSRDSSLGSIWPIIYFILFYYYFSNGPCYFIIKIVVNLEVCIDGGS